MQTEHIVDNVEHLLIGDVPGSRWELRLQQIADVLDRVPQAGIGFQQRLRDHRRHVQVVDLLSEGAALRFNSGAHLLVVSVLACPDCESRTRVLLGEPSALEQHREERQSDSIALARSERAGRRPQATEALARGAELGEVVTNFVRKGDDVTGPIPTRQLDVVPEVFQNPNEMGLAAAVEATHPHRRLLGLAQILQEAVENPLQAACVLAVAHEAAQLPPEDIPLLGCLRPYDLRDTVVRDLGISGISVEELPVGQGHRVLPLAVIGIAK